MAGCTYVTVKEVRTLVCGECLNVAMCVPCTWVVEQPGAALRLLCMALVGRLESCKTEVMRRLITEKSSDVQAVCTASHLEPPALPLLYHDALSGNSSPNSGQVRLPFCCTSHCRILTM